MIFIQFNNTKHLFNLAKASNSLTSVRQFSKTHSPPIGTFTVHYAITLHSNIKIKSTFTRNGFYTFIQCQLK